MDMSANRSIRLAILDLYDGHANEGMRCIRQLLKQYSDENNVEIIKDEFDVRLKSQLPDLSYDIYISSGGPGSPLDSMNTNWENLYFLWLKKIEEFNNNPSKYPKKQVLFICHSFQLACRFFRIAKVAKRRSTAFGVFPVHRLEDGRDEPVFAGLQDPFYAVDSR